MVSFLGRAGTVRSHWSLALILYGIAGLLIGFRETLPPWLASVIANILAGSSIILIHRGTWLMLGKKPPDFVYCASLAALGLIYYQFTIGTPDTGIRLLTISMFRVPFFVSAAFALRSSHIYRNLSGANALIYILLAGAAWYFFRGCLAISSHELAIMLRTGPAQGINFLFASVGNIVITIALSRIEAEQAINRANDLACQLKHQSDSLEATIHSQTFELKREVSERKQAQYELHAEHQRLLISEQRFFRTFDQAPIGASIVSLDGRYLRANQEFERISGYSEIELQKVTVLDITHPDDRTISAESARRLLAGEISHSEEVKRYIRRDGTEVWVHVSVRIMRGDDGEPLFFLPMMADITEKRNAEIELQAAKNRAEKSLEDLLTTQNILIHAEKMASLGRLVAGAAHEINTPLGVSVTVGSLLSDRFDRLENDFNSGNLRRSIMEEYIADSKEAYKLLLSNIQRTAELVQAFKTVAADQTGDRRRIFDLGHCLSETLLTISPIWRKAGHRAEVTSPTKIEIDGYPGVIGQIITNFVTNSVVHAFPSGQHGSIIIVADTVDANMVRICYSDDGVGIGPELRDKVFEPFFTTRRGSGSTGLGLHIIYNLVVGKLGGKIDITPNYPTGVVFNIVFPSAPIVNGL